MFVEEQPTWRLWGEERLDSAIYTVYLKKVRYHSPSRSITTEADDGISHLEWETVRVRFVKGGTLCRLVENLASADTGEIESTYVNVFLATYRTFASPKQVLNLLIERYEELSQADEEETSDRCQVRVTTAPTRPRLRIREEIREQHCRTLRQALHVWLDQYPEDFDDPPNYLCLTQLEAFCRRVLPNSELDIKVHRKASQIRRPPEPPPPPQKLGYPSGSGGSRPPPLLLKSANLIHPGLNNNQPAFAKDSPDHPSVTTAPTASILGDLETGESPFGDFLEIPERLFARQLTRMDCELFKGVIPHQCLGAVWSRRDKSRDRDAATVVATIEQFNAVSYRVISSILMTLEAKPQHRAKVITKWIDIAQELRLLKNFSSLKAIISGLQSNPIYRLKKAWSYLMRDKLEIFEELARIFSGENNALAQRELLVREGTARFADTVGENDHHMQKILQKHSENSRVISYGTIPYLGTFLTDLTMIDTAIADMTHDGLINFDKRRKEFEVLAQIKLLQGAANAYHIETDAKFNRWFEAVLLLDEREAFDLSCKLEPGSGHASSTPSNSQIGSSSQPSSGSKDKKIKKRSNGFYHRKNDSIASTASSSSESQFYFDSDLNKSSSLLEEKLNLSPDPDEDIDGVLTTPLGRDSAGGSGRWSSAPSSATSHNGATSVDSCSQLVSSEPRPKSSTTKSDLDSSSGPGGDRAFSKSSVKSMTKPTADSPYKTSEFYIIRVSIESSGPETEGVIMYKSIMIGNHERTREVIRNAMMKHGLEGSPDNYTLSQVLPDKAELTIPSNANVYYAISTQHDLNFVLREKQEELNGSALPESNLESSLLTGTPQSGIRKASRDASKARRKLMGIHL